MLDSILTAQVFRFAIYFIQLLIPFRLQHIIVTYNAYQQISKNGDDSYAKQHKQPRTTSHRLAEIHGPPSGS